MSRSRRRFFKDSCVVPLYFGVGGALLGVLVGTASALVHILANGHIGHGLYRLALVELSDRLLRSVFVLAAAAVGGRFACQVTQWCVYKLAHRLGWSLRRTWTASIASVFLVVVGSYLGSVSPLARSTVRETPVGAYLWRLRDACRAAPYAFGGASVVLLLAFVLTPLMTMCAGHSGDGTVDSRLSP